MRDPGVGPEAGTRPDRENAALNSGRTWRRPCAVPTKRNPCSIWVGEADGSHPRRIATNAFDPAWSPDGRQIAFARPVAKGNTEIYVINAEAADPVGSRSTQGLISRPHGSLFVRERSPHRVT